MFPRIIRATALLSALATMLALCFPAGAQNNPGVIDANAEPVSATSIRVFWEDDPLAEGYRVYRTGSGVIAEVAEDVNEYLDTGLTPGIPYYYGVISLVGGKEYWMNTPDFGAMPLDAPGEVTILAMRKVSGGNHSRLEIDLTWTPVSLYTKYEVYARAGVNNVYNFMQYEDSNAATVSFPMPDETRTYWFKVRILYEGYYVQEYDYYMSRNGPFSPEVSATWYELVTWKPIFDLYWRVHVWPWENPYHAEYLKRILEAYAEPGLWPGEVAPEPGTLAGLAGKLARGEALTEAEQAVAGAIHPHGLALLAGAYLAPPDEEEARALVSRLGSLAGLMGGGLPEGLTGSALETYRKELSEAGALVALKLETGTDTGSSPPRLRFTLPGGSGDLLKNIPGQLTTPTSFPIRELPTAPVQLITLQPVVTVAPMQMFPRPKP